NDYYTEYYYIESVSSLRFCFLCVPSYVHPRVLHSFPTRRSSDLKYCSSASSTLSASSHAAASCRPGISAWMRRWSSSLTMTLTADRKSTRLNSSHVKISYAVFCLKKKKKKKQKFKR